jgi:hypothetical protein
LLSHIAITEDVVALNSQFPTHGVNHQKASDIYINYSNANEKRERGRGRGKITG